MGLIKNLVLLMLFVVLLPIVIFMGLCSKAAVDVAQESIEREEKQKLSPAPARRKPRSPSTLCGARCPHVAAVGQY